LFNSPTDSTQSLAKASQNPEDQLIDFDNNSRDLSTDATTIESNFNNNFIDNLTTHNLNNNNLSMLVGSANDDDKGE